MNRATEIRLLAERQMGAFLEIMPKSSGKDFSGNGTVSSPKERIPDAPPTLAEIGIAENQSHRARKLADIPLPEFKERIAVAKASGGKLTTAAILRPTKRPGTPQKKSEYTIAQITWYGVKRRLDVIRDNDPKMPEVMREISRYALNRIKSKH